MSDPSKCASMHLGMGSTCHYHRDGQGTLWERTYWRCSDACLAEQAARDLALDPVHDAIHRWHHSDTDAELHQWLGLTWEQYAAWVERGVLPDGYELPVRARRDVSVAGVKST